jgi:predicted N-formylglutamate amidohydrolase
MVCETNFISYATVRGIFAGMLNPSDYRLLSAGEPPPVFEEGLQRQSDFLITVDHASARIPRILGDLGLPASELQRHIAWDIGALGVARLLAGALDAPLLAQNYSRLVIDCNRNPDVPSSIPTIGENIAIPGNVDLAATHIEARRREIFRPYHQRIKEVLDMRLAAGRATILIAQHSMTDVFHGVVRPMHAAILYNRDRRFAGLTLEALRQEAGLVVADNEPYFVSDATDYTIPVHGEARGLPHVEIEVRQDLLATPGGQKEWAARIATALRAAQQQFQP